MKFLSAGSAMARSLSKTCVRAGDYERCTADVTRTTRRSCRFICGVTLRGERSGTLVEMRAQFVNGGEAHHALGHLRLDRTVGIQRIGHSIDHAGFEHGYRRRLFASARLLTACPRRGGLR